MLFWRSASDVSKFIYPRERRQRSLLLGSSEKVLLIYWTSTCP